MSIREREKKNAQQTKLENVPNVHKGKKIDKKNCSVPTMETGKLAKWPQVEKGTQALSGPHRQLCCHW